MKREFLSFLVIFLIGALTVVSVLYVQAKREGDSKPAGTAMTAASPSPSPAMTYPMPKERVYAETIALPAPRIKDGLPLNKALYERRTRRAFSEKVVTLAQISQMLWSGQGITVPGTTKRTAPSARESYSMTLFVVVRSAEKLEPGVYEYLPDGHKLGKVTNLTDVDAAMKAAAVQDAAQKAPVVFMISSSFGRYQAKTKSPNVNATYMEAGHISQNMYLEAESLGMATVTMAGFDSTKVTAALSIDPAETVQYVMPFGHRGVEVVEKTVETKK